jgi:DNA-binding MarR family transcriptional regulator
MRTEKPIGWYLKEADQQMTTYINEGFRKLDITRFHWMLLRNISERKSVNTQQFYLEVKHYVTEQQFREIVQSLITRGWVAEDDNYNCSFTTVGEVIFQEITEIQQVRTAQIMQGISEDEYAQIINLLSKIIRNTASQK